MTAPQLENLTCKQCRWWKKTLPAAGLCCLNPPAVYVHGRVAWAWPETMAHDYCSHAEDKAVRLGSVSVSTEDP